MNSYKSYINKLRWDLYLNLMRDEGGDEQNTIFLAGEGRSGTTWISDLINTNKDFRELFEPFNRMYNLKNKLFVAHHYFNPNTNYPEHLKEASKILRGEYKNVTIDFKNRNFKYRRRLIKEITASMYLKWLHITFPNMPIIYVFRYPISIAFSRIKRKGGWGTFDKTLIYQEELIDKYLNDKLNSIEKLHLDNPFINQLFSVCLNHYIVVKECLNAGILFLFYEDFKQDPVKNLRRIQDHTQQKLDYKTITNNNSTGAGFSHGKLLYNHEVIDKLKTEFHKNIVFEAHFIMELFDINYIYDQNGKLKIEGDLKSIDYHNE